MEGIVIAIWDAESKTSVAWTVDSWPNVGSFLAKIRVTFKHLNRFRSLVCFAQVSSSSMCDGVFVWWQFCAIERVFSGQLSDFWGVWSSPIHFSREIHRCYWLTVFCLGLNTGSCKMSKIEEQIVAFDSPSEIHSWNINSTSKNTTKKNIRNFKIWMWRNGLGPTPSCPSPSPVGCTPVAPLRRYLAWKNAVSNLSFSVRALSFWMFFSKSVVCTSQRLVTWIAWWRWYAMDLCDEERTLVMRRSNMGPRSKTHHSTLLLAHRETLDFLRKTHQSLGSQREGIIDPLQSCSFITSVALEIQLLKPEILRIHLYTPTPTQMEFRCFFYTNWGSLSIPEIESPTGGVGNGLKVDKLSSPGRCFFLALSDSNLLAKLMGHCPGVSLTALGKNLIAPETTAKYW